jgi:hypothetical protein
MILFRRSLDGDCRLAIFGGWGYPFGRIFNHSRECDLPRRRESITSHSELHNSWRFFAATRSVARRLYAANSWEGTRCKSRVPRRQCSFSGEDHSHRRRPGRSELRPSSLRCKRVDGPGSTRLTPSDCADIAVADSADRKRKQRIDPSIGIHSSPGNLMIALLR